MLMKEDINMRNFPTQKPDSLWDFMSEVERAFDDVWRNPARGALTTRATPTFTPAVDLHETPDFFLISVDVPGIDPKDIKIDVQHGRLSIGGTRERENKSDDGMFGRFERSYGSFERSFQLPQNVDESKIQARFENGVLEVMVPKAEVAKARSVQIDNGKGGLFSRLLGKKDVEPAQAEDNH